MQTDRGGARNPAGEGGTQAVELNSDALPRLRPEGEVRREQRDAALRDFLVIFAASMSSLQVMADRLLKKL